jgi:hypothetical protein
MMRVIKFFYFFQNFMLNPNLESDLQKLKKKPNKLKKQKSSFFYSKPTKPNIQKV